MPIPVIFERRTTRRVVATATAGKLNGGVDVRIVDLSLEGVAIESELALAAGQEASLELRHPILAESMTITVRAIWCRIAHGKRDPSVGMLFPTVSVEQRATLRRFVAAEAGSCVLVGGEATGFLVETAEGMWSVFGASATKVAYINREGPGRYQVCTGVGQDPRMAPRYHQAPTLLRAVSAACMRTAPSLEPPVPEPGEAPPPPPPPKPAPPVAKPAPPPPPPAKPEDSSRELQPWEAWAAKRKDAAKSSHHEEEDEAQESTLYGSAVRSKGAIVGYVALTGAGVWSLYDADQNQIGVLSKSGTGYTVYWLGATAESSMAFVSADSFPGAIAVAFELDEFPGLTSAPISPQTRTKTAPVQKPRNWGGSRVVFRKRLIGYVMESAIDDTWAIVNKSMEQIALLTRDSFPPYRFRAVLMGSSVEESMEYFMHESLHGAIAGAFGLPGVPLIDPPVQISDPPAG